MSSFDYIVLGIVGVSGLLGLIRGLIKEVLSLSAYLLAFMAAIWWGPRTSGWIQVWVENGLLDTLEEIGIGSIVFSPLEQGILTSKYIGGIPEGSRAATKGSYLDRSQITDEVVDQVTRLNKIAEARGQILAQMAVAWLLKDQRVTSVLVGVSKVSQLEDNIAAIKNIDFSQDELRQINEILKK